MNCGVKRSRRLTVERLEFLVLLLAFSAVGLGGAIARGARGWIAIDGLLATASLGMTLKHLRRLVFDSLNGALSKPPSSYRSGHRSLS
ncbi:MAG: hypothetical protein ACRDJG_10300 [Actinomycetota bacterium]